MASGIAPKRLNIAILLQPSSATLDFFELNRVPNFPRVTLSGEGGEYGDDEMHKGYVSMNDFQSISGCYAISETV